MSIELRTIRTTKGGLLMGEDLKNEPLNSTEEKESLSGSNQRSGGNFETGSAEASEGLIIRTVQQETAKPEIVNLSISRKAIKRIGIALIILIVLGAITAGLLIYNNYSNQKHSAAVKQTYENNLRLADMLIVSAVLTPVDVCGQYSKVWSDAIDSGYKDFNTELANQRNQFETDGTINKMKDAKNAVDKIMGQLANPPQEYTRAYEKLLQLYGIYSKIESQAESPSGSLITFNNTINSLQTDFLQASNELNVILPPKK